MLHWAIFLATCLCQAKLSKMLLSVTFPVQNEHVMQHFCFRKSLHEIELILLWVTKTLQGMYIPDDVTPCNISTFATSLSMLQPNFKTIYKFGMDAVRVGA